MKKYFFVVLFFCTAIVWAQESADTDGDGWADTVDRCPSVAAKGSSDGCGDWLVRTGVGSDMITVQRRSRAVSFHEKTVLRQGDLFQARIMDPMTGEIYSQSRVLTVR